MRQASASIWQDGVEKAVVTGVSLLPGDLRTLYKGVVPVHRIVPSGTQMYSYDQIKQSVKLRGGRASCCTYVAVSTIAKRVAGAGGCETARVLTYRDKFSCSVEANFVGQ